MAEQGPKDVYSVDDARTKAGVNRETEWFVSRIERAASDGKHYARLMASTYISDEDLAALYELRSSGFTVERIAVHFDNESDHLIPESFYAFW